VVVKDEEEEEVEEEEKGRAEEKGAPLKIRPFDVLAHVGAIGIPQGQISVGMKTRAVSFSAAEPFPKNLIVAPSIKTRLSIAFLLLADSPLPSSTLSPPPHRPMRRINAGATFEIQMPFSL
jgi:hypothetical protein